MEIELRSEAPSDCPAIDAVICGAFQKMDTANLVRLYREDYPAYTPKYAIASWKDGALVGFALYLPFRMNLMDRQIRAVALGMNAVVPEHQRRGIGRRQVLHGLELAKEDGFSLAVTNGNPGYYRKIGYESCFGRANIAINVDSLPVPKSELRACPVTEGDTSWITQCHEIEYANVDFSWARSASIGEWTSRFTDTVVWRTSDGQRAAYTARKPESKSFEMILGDQPDLVRDIIAFLKPQEIRQHPSGWLARNVIRKEWGSASATPWGPALGFELEAGILDEYKRCVKAGTRPVGHFNWPLLLIAAG